MRSIQSGEIECTALSGRSGRSHLVLVCAECHRPHPLLNVKNYVSGRQHRWALDFSETCRSRYGFD